VLEGIEAVVGQLGDILARRPDAEDAALLADRTFVFVVAVDVAVSGRSVARRHAVSPRSRGGKPASPV